MSVHKINLRCRFVSRNPLRYKSLLFYRRIVCYTSVLPVITDLRVLINMGLNRYLAPGPQIGDKMNPEANVGRRKRRNRITNR